MEVHDESRHIVVIRRGQFCESLAGERPRLNVTDWFDCLDSKNRPILSDKEIFSTLEAIVKDADKTPVHQVAQNALGILTTESRKIWSHLRTELIKSNKNNASSLAVVESALFVVCLDDSEPEDLAELCGNFLCGGYKLDGGVQVGTCTNRWYDKVSIRSRRGTQLMCSCKSLCARMERQGSTLSTQVWMVTQCCGTLPTCTPSLCCSLQRCVLADFGQRSSSQ